MILHRVSLDRNASATLGSPEVSAARHMAFAALHTTMIFGAIAVIGFLLTVVWFTGESFRARRRDVRSQPDNDITSSD